MALSVVGPLALLLASRPAVQAQTTFPRIVNFDDATKTGFRLGGKPSAATIVATSSTTGLLRLTNNSTFQAGFAIDNASFPAPSGFSISFEYFAYNGTGADGFSVFLIDADKTSAAAFTSGAPGGALGYAQRNIANDANNSPGVPNGYIGIGIDEYGNFANTSEGKVGGQVTGTTLVKDAVSVRGAGAGASAASTTDYPYLAGSSTLPFSLSIPAATARVTDPNSPDYRRAYIDVTPQTINGAVSYKIRVRIQHGTQIQTAIENVTVPTPPDNLRIGFSGSTGGSTNFHEIDNLAVLQAPITNDDYAQTKYNQPITLNVLANDVFSYSPYQMGSVDLNLGVAGTQNTISVTGGTLTATADGKVTFTPDGTFAGVITVPYRVQDATGFSNTTNGNPDPYYSNPSNIIITVTGADVASSISGPTTANPGSQITYSINTTNIGVETAINVIPTLLLPKNLAVVSSPSYSYNATTGLVTFNQTTLARNAAVANAVTFTVPATGTTSITGTAGYTYPAGAVVPDPVVANNTASITTTIGGIANVATACATPGKDGPGTLDANSQPNTYYPGTASVSAGATSLTLGAAAGSTTAISTGDLLLVMQMQGADINTTNTSAYGAGGTSGSGNLATNFTAGRYEYAIATNAVATSGGTLTLKGGLANAYQQQDYNGTVTGQRRFQVVRVPQYSSLTLTGTITGAAWNGTTGGVLVLDVAGQTTFNTNATLDMSGKGFRGGGGKQYTGAGIYANTDYRNASSTSTAAAHAAKGEGTAGTPRFVNLTYSSLVDTGTEGYLNGSVGAGAPGNAGGGGTDFIPASNSGNSGGAGGGNGGAGGLGGYGRTSGSTGTRAAGGSVFASSAGLLILGGGGGAGTNDNAGGTTPSGLTNTALASSGAAGGGVILLRMGSVSGTGTLLANGAAALSTVGTDAAGGGGAGGSVVLLASTPGTLNTLTVQVNGGNGGNAATDNTSRGPGGGGGGGVIYTNGALSASFATGGNSGVTNAGANTAFGATSGATGTVTTNVDASKAGGISSNSSCLPTLTAALSAAPNNVTRATGNAVNPVIYTLTVSNTGGAATGASASTTLNNLFKYDNTFTPVVTLTLADGSTATVTGYTGPTSGTSTPTFSSLTIPAGASLTIKFRATITSSAVDGVVYNASSTIVYNNPMRTGVAATTTVSPGGNYASGNDTSLGTAGGSNYNGTLAANTSEDVTIVKALPVELTRFEVAAAGLDARLSWTTASEKNNAYFEVQRSLDGEQFETIGKRTGQGSTQAKTDYAYADAGAGRLLTGQPIYYRLRQVDYDGQEAFSPVRVVTFGQTAQTSVALYPNPTAQQPTVFLDLTGLPVGAYQVQVLDLTGRQLQQQTLAGGQLHRLAVQSLPMGSYLVTVHGGAIHLNLKLVRD